MGFYGSLLVCVVMLQGFFRLSSVLLSSLLFFSGVSFGVAKPHSPSDVDKKELGIVDMQMIEAKADVIQDLTNKLQAEQSRVRDLINNKSKDLQRRAKELEQKRGVLSATAIEEKRKALENELIVLQTDAQAKGDGIQNAKNEALVEIDLKIRGIVQRVATARGIQLVVPKQVALFIDDSLAKDITDDVLRDLNISTKTVDISKYLSGGSASSGSVRSSRGSKK